VKEGTILIFGDSIAYGASDNEFGGWVNRLRIYLDNKLDIDYNIFNLSIPGETTKDVLKRFQDECKARYQKGKKLMVVFAIGINDTQNIGDKNRVTIEQFKKNIKILINVTKKFTKEILFIGFTKVDEVKTVPVSWDNEKSFYNKKIVEFDKALENICEISSVKYLKVYDLLNLTDLEDGIHPNRAGHEKLFKSIFNKLKGFIL